MGRTQVTYIIKELREQRGWSIRHLANLSEISHTHLRDIENNKAHATVPVIWDIADSFGVSPRDLYIKQKKVVTDIIKVPLFDGENSLCKSV